MNVPGDGSAVSGCGPWLLVIVALLAFRLLVFL